MSENLNALTKEEQNSEGNYALTAFTDKFVHISHVRMHEKQWRLAFYNNIMKPDSVDYIQVELADDTNDMNEGSFKLHISDVYNFEKDEINRKLSSMLDDIVDWFQGAFEHFVIDAGFFEEMSDKSIKKVPTEKRKPFSYVEDLKDEYFDMFPQKILKNIDYTMKIDVEKFLKQNQWSVKEFNKETPLGIKLFELWRNNSIRRNSTWTRYEKCKDYFSNRNFSIEERLVCHAKQLFMEQGKEWKMAKVIPMDNIRVFQFK